MMDMDSIPIFIHTSSYIPPIFRHDVHLCRAGYCIIYMLYWSASHRVENDYLFFFFGTGLIVPFFIARRRDPVFFDDDENDFHSLKDLRVQIRIIQPSETD